MIEFGRDGWFGVISDEITFENISITAQAAADYLIDTCSSATVVLGYDTRFLSREYAWTIMRVLTGNGINVYLHKKPVPTAFLSLSTALYKADLGIMVTGEGRPARYTGLTFKLPRGQPAGEAFMSDLFNYLYRRYPRHADENRDLLKYIDVFSDYAGQAAGLMSQDGQDRKAPVVIYDACFGSVGGYFKELLELLGLNSTAIRSKPNPGFMDCAPQPNNRNLQLAGKLVKQKKGNIGLFFNGDGSRLGVVDSNGDIVPDHWVSAIVLKEWLDIKGSGLRVYTELFTPSVSAPLLSSMGITPLPSYRLYEQKEDPGLAVVWDRHSVSCGGFVPDRDAMAEALLLIRALMRYGLDWQALLADIIRVTGMRSFGTRSLSMDKGTWTRKRKLMMGQGLLPGELGSVINTEENGDLKLWLDDGSWLGFCFNPKEEHLSVYYDAPGLGQAEEKLDLIVSLLLY